MERATGALHRDVNMKKPATFIGLRAFSLVQQTKAPASTCIPRCRTVGVQGLYTAQFCRGATGAPLGGRNFSFKSGCVRVFKRTGLLLASAFHTSRKPFHQRIPGLYRLGIPITGATLCHRQPVFIASRCVTGRLRWETVSHPYRTWCRVNETKLCVKVLCLAIRDKADVPTFRDVGLNVFNNFSHDSFSGNNG